MEINSNVLPNTQNLPEIDFKQYRITPKFEEWRRLYLDRTNKATFGNATRSALQAYNLDEATQYNVAHAIGHDNLQKHTNLAVIVKDYLTDNGFTLPVFIDHALRMMADPKVKTTHWWKELLSIAGYLQEKEKTSVTVQQNNANITNITQLSPQEAEEFTRDFTAFIESKNHTVAAPNPVDTAIAAG